MAYTDIDTDDLFTRMFGAAREDARASWEAIRGVLKIELKGLARELKELGKGVALGDIAQEQARLVLRLQRGHIATLVAALTPGTMPVVEGAVAAALEAVRPSVNAAVGFDLI